MFATKSNAPPVRKTFVKNLQNMANNTLIWIQGFITDIDKEQDTLIISDETGGVEVRSYTNVPGDVDWIRCGKYCMLIGHLQRTSYLFIKALKLSDLSGNSFLQRMWEDEVKDINQAVYMSKDAS